MAGKFGFIEYHDKSHRTVSLDQAIKIQAILDCTVEPDNQAQADYVLNVKRVYLPPSARISRPDMQKQDLSALDLKDEQTGSTHGTGLTNIGVLQGKASSLPRNDQ